MAAANFDRALEHVLRHEGGYSNHPSDPGGPTKFGITIADYRRHVKPGATAADVRAMKPGEARAIYRRHYWDALRCDDLPPGVDYAVFDYGVNSGIGRAGKVLRRLTGLPDKTHVVGDDGLCAVRQREAAQLIVAICDERLAFLKRLRTWPEFGAGWGRRVAEVRATALTMARARNAVPGVKTGRLATGGIAVAAGVAAHEAHRGGIPLALVFAVLAIAGLAAAVWRWRRSKKWQER